MSNKKESLLLVAEKLFYQYGFHSIGLKRIINESNIAIMTLYNHFNSKDDLIVEVLKRREQLYIGHLKHYLVNDRSSTFLKLAEGHADWLVKNERRGCMFLRAKEEFGGDPVHPIVELVNNHKEAMIDFILKIDAAITREKAMQLMLLLEGATALAETEDPNIVGIQLVDMTNRLFHLS
ncbi:TetR/AcrR family transcriptional regulator [Bacillus gobiensis]|uniref:TetR/AcrR family transcriptional regulator n=1 Tax=Bacillus gobiensis TaxID=1441095 RepID=UPI003D22CB02